MHAPAFIYYSTCITIGPGRQASALVYAAETHLASLLGMQSGDYYTHQIVPFSLSPGTHLHVVEGTRVRTLIANAYDLGIYLRRTSL